MARKRSVDRRDFLKGAAVTGAAALVPDSVASAAQAPSPAAPAQRPAAALTAAREADPAVEVDALTTDRPGGDFMVDVLKSLNIEYVASNPGSSFRGIHESIINYGGNKMPEFLTCCHEESSVAMAHAYFKVEGKPMAVLCHGTVGLQHAAMALQAATVALPLCGASGGQLVEQASHEAGGRGLADGVAQPATQCVASTRLRQPRPGLEVELARA